MGLITALAISIGLLGGIATYLVFSDPLMLGLQIWAVFIGWASFYHCGGKGGGFVSSVLANLWGVVWATLTLLAVSQLPFGEALGLPVWAGICVAIGVGVMILGCMYVRTCHSLRQSACIHARKSDALRICHANPVYYRPRLERITTRKCISGRSIWGS